jgi:parvulin-like peptidyl-prolyl isomerase
MRRNMKVVLWFTIIFFVLLIFLVWGADLQFGGSNVQPNTIGRVNGQDISTADYQQAVSSNRRAAQSRGAELTPNDELTLEQQAWDAIVDEILLRQEADARGLQATSDEIRTVLLNDPPPLVTQDPAMRKEDGSFDIDTYQALLRDPNTPEIVLLQLESYVRATLPLQKVQEVVIRSVRVTDDELRRAYRDRNEKARITYTMAESFRQTAPSRITDEQVQAYYEEHRDRYLEPRRVDLNYVSIPRRATAQDSVELVRELAEFARNARLSLEAEAQGKVDINVNDFATLAETFSELPSAEEGGLSAGFLKPAEMSPAMGEAVAGLSPGEISEPFQDGDFYHIVMAVEEQEQDGERAVQIRDLGLRIAPSDSTILATQELLENVRKAARTAGLAAAAEQFGLEMKTANNVKRDGIVPGLAAIPGLGDFAHDNPIGSLSRVYAASNAWYVLEVGAVLPEEYASVEEAEGRIRSEILRDRRQEASRLVIDRVLGRVKLGESLEEAAAAESLTVSTPPEFTRGQGVPTLGQDPAVLGAAFSVPVGEVSGPVESTRGWMLLRVEERPEVDWTQFEGQKPVLRQTLRATKQNQVLEAFLEDLRRRAKIEDYRGRILG